MLRGRSARIRDHTWIDSSSRTLEWPGPAPGGDPERKLYFLHVPKTAGTALHLFLRTLFNIDQVCPAYTVPELAAYDRDALGRFRYFAGHLSLALPALLAEPPAVVTVVREPHAQARSAYEHPLRVPNHPLHDLSAQNSFAEWLGDARAAPFVYNPQGRYLAGNVSGERAMSDDELYERAVATLDSTLWYSTSEMLDRTIADLAAALRWPAPLHLLRANVAPTPVPDPTEEEVDLLAHVTAVDQRVYRHVVRTTSMQGRALPERARSHGIVRRDVVDLSETLTVDLGHPLWGSGWWPPERLSDEESAVVRWIAPGEPATVQLPVRLRRGDRIECFVRRAADGRFVSEMDVRVDGAPTSLASLRDEVGCVVAAFDVDRSTRGGAHLSFCAQRDGGPEQPFEAVYSAGRAVAIERLELIPAPIEPSP